MASFKVYVSTFYSAVWLHVYLTHTEQDLLQVLTKVLYVQLGSKGREEMG